MSSRILLMLDIDETLIHARYSELDHPPDLMIGNYYVYKRPYLDDFLVFCNEHFELAVWSSAGPDYIDQVVQIIIPSLIKLKLVWDRSHCVRRFESGMLWESSSNICYLKDLNKKSLKKKLDELNFNPSRILIIDDDCKKLRRNYGNAIYVNEFTGDQNDKELLLLKRYLTRFRDVEDVLRIEKRNWRDQVRKNQ